MRHEAAEHVIPTQFKSRLPKTLTWPVGAEVMTAGLGDAPHAAECRLWFSDSPVSRLPSSSGLPRGPTVRRPRRRVSSRYQHSVRSIHRDGGGRGDYDAKWEIRVNPVPRVWRAAVRALLREQGLPLVADGCAPFKGLGWQDRHHRLELVFAPADGTLAKKLVGRV